MATRASVQKAIAKERALRKRLGKFTQFELWDLDMTLSYVILPRLKAFAKAQMGHPGTMTAKEWDAIVKKMIRSFELKLDDEAWKLGDKRHEARRAKIEEGLRLFGEHFEHLWI